MPPFWFRLWKLFIFLFFLTTTGVDVRTGDDSNAKPAIIGEPSVQATRNSLVAVSEDEHLSAVSPLVKRRLARFARSTKHAFFALEIGIKLLTRFTYLIPVVCLAAWPITVGFLQDEYPYVARSIPTNYRTLILTILLVFLKYSNLRVLMGHLENRQLPAIPSLLIFSITFVPTFEDLRKNKEFGGITAAAGLVWLVILSFWVKIRNEFELQEIREYVRKNPVSQAARDAATTHLDAIRPGTDWLIDLAEQSILSWVLAALIGYIVDDAVEVRKTLEIFNPPNETPPPRFSWWSKISVLPVLGGFIAIHLYVYFQEGLLFADLLVWGAWTMGRLAICVFTPHISPKQTWQLFTDIVSGTMLSFVQVTLEYLFTEEENLSWPRNFWISTGLLMFTTTTISHYVGPFLSAVGGFLFITVPVFIGRTILRFAIWAYSKLPTAISSLIRTAYHWLSLPFKWLKTFGTYLWGKTGKPVVQTAGPPILAVLSFMGGWVLWATRKAFLGVDFAADWLFTSAGHFLSKCISCIRLSPRKRRSAPSEAGHQLPTYATAN